MAARRAGSHESYSNQRHGHGMTPQSSTLHAPQTVRNIQNEHWSLPKHIRASGTAVGSSSARSKQADYLLWPQFYGTWRVPLSLYHQGSAEHATSPCPRGTSRRGRQMEFDVLAEENLTLKRKLRHVVTVANSCARVLENERADSENDGMHDTDTARCFGYPSDSSRTKAA